MPHSSRFHQLPLRVGLVGFALIALGLAAGSCLAPTELKLHVHTNVPCTDPSQWQGVAVYVGTPGASLEDKAPTLSTTTCDQNGQVGSLVVVPSGAKDAEVGLRVVAGLDYRPEDCAAHHYQGCIVARRSVRFDTHNPLDLDIALTSDCISLGCDATHTCVDGTCSIASAEPVATTATAVEDAGPQVRCGDNGVLCPTSGNVCCLSVDADAGTSFGECMPSHECPRGSIVLNCDDSSDCADRLDDAGRPDLCLMSYMFLNGSASPLSPGIVSLTACVARPTNLSSSDYLEMCQVRQPCLNGSVVCHASLGYPENPLPGYFWCNDSF
ncbi:MAG TPA: hypothetical protein VNW92_09175 [Polyangiaceae bacterium]|jgi:hypothetical protein|nr:hypothetical protein [Polyangiaceae bacterium]